MLARWRDSGRHLAGRFVLDTRAALRSAVWVADRYYKLPYTVTETGYAGSELRRAHGEMRNGGGNGGRTKHGI